MSCVDVELLLIFKCMLTTLRKIRKSLLDSGSKRYLLYAIGEIALVVIGILIALQINEWSQERLNRKFEREYLERFILDISKDSSTVAFVDKELAIKKVRLLHVRKVMEDPTITMNDSIMALLNKSHTLGTDLPNARLTATYQEIISSGHLRLLRNVELRNSITNYYAAWDHIYYRIENKQSDYPSLVLKIIDRGNVFSDNPIHEGKNLAQILSINNIESEFRLNFMKEVNYMIFTKNLVDGLKIRVSRLKSQILEELEKFE